MVISKKQSAIFLLIILVCTILWRGRSILRYQIVGPVSNSSCLLAFPLPIQDAQTGYGSLRCNKDIIGRPIQIGGQYYSRGISSHAPSLIRFSRIPKSENFTNLSGIFASSDSISGRPGSVVGRIELDGVEIWRSPVMPHGTSAFFSVSIEHGRDLTLFSEDAGDGITYDEVAWVNLKLR
jgi:hypothetical protein